MRTRKVVIPEAEGSYLVGALTLEQVELFIAPLEKLGGDEAKIRAYELVCYGLNNADKSGDTAGKWTKDRVFKELDMVTFMKLQEEILDLSGLKLSKDKQLGEAQTAPVLISEPSAAVS
jgi:hypothetical protein